MTRPSRPRRARARLRPPRATAGALRDRGPPRARRDPDGAEGLPSSRPHLGRHDVVGDGPKLGDRAVARDDEPEKGRLHAPDREHAARSPAGPAEQGVEARHVHAEEPVGALTRERRLVERSVLGVGLERAELPAHGLGTQVADEKAIDGPAVAEKVEHLVDEQLPLAIGVARVDDALRICEADAGSTPASSGAETSSFQSLGAMGRLLEAPGLVRLAVRFGRRHLQDVPCAPRDDVARAALDVRAGALLRPGQRLGDGAGEARLFGDEQAHGGQTDPFAARA